MSATIVSNNNHIIPSFPNITTAVIRRHNIIQQEKQTSDTRIQQQQQQQQQQPQRDDSTLFRRSTAASPNRISTIQQNNAIHNNGINHSYVSFLAALHSTSSVKGINDAAEFNDPLGLSLPLPVANSSSNSAETTVPASYLSSSRHHSLDLAHLHQPSKRLLNQLFGSDPSDHNIHRMMQIQRLSMYYQQIYFIPPCEFAVDETMVGFKGRSRWKTVIKSKPTPIGYKCIQWLVMDISLTLISTKAKVAIPLHRGSSIILLPISSQDGLASIVSSSLMIYTLLQHCVVISSQLVSIPVVPFVLTVKVYPLTSNK